MRLLKLVLPVATITPALLSASCFGGKKDEEKKPVDTNPGDTSKPENPENPSNPGNTEGETDKPSTQPVKYSKIIELFNSGSIFKKKISYQEFLKFTNQEGKETGRIDHYINKDGSITISINKNAATLNESVFSDELLKLSDFTINFKKETDKVGFAYRDDLQKGFEIADENATAENAKSSSSRLVFKVDKEAETITILSVALYKYIPDKGLILLVPAEKDFVISVDESTKKPVDNTENTTPENPSTPVEPEVPSQPETGETNNSYNTDSEKENTSKNDTVVQPSVDLPENYESLSDSEKILYLYNNDLVFKKYISEEDFKLLSSQDKKKQRIDFDNRKLVFYLGGNNRNIFKTDIFSQQINEIFGFTKNVKRDLGKIGVVYMDKNNESFIGNKNNRSASGRFVYEVDEENKTITIKTIAVADFTSENGFTLYSPKGEYKDFVIKIGTAADLEAQENPNTEDSDEDSKDPNRVIISDYETIKNSEQFNAIKVDAFALPIVFENLKNKIEKVKSSVSEEGLEKLNQLETKLNEYNELIKLIKNEKLPNIFKKHFDNILTSDNIKRINQILEKSESEVRMLYDSLNITEGDYLAVVQILSNIWEETINIVVDANNGMGSAATVLNAGFIKPTGAKLKSIYQKALSDIYAEIVELNYLETKKSIDQLVKDLEYINYEEELYSLKQYEVLLNNALTSSTTLLSKYNSELKTLQKDAENNKTKISELSRKISSLQSAQFQVKTFLNSNKEELETLKSLTFDQLSNEQQSSLSSLKYKLMTLKSQLERSMK